MVAMTVRVVVTGDNHLNYYSQKFCSRLAWRRAEIGRAWRETVDYAIEKKADLYLNVGDLFDQLAPRNPPRSRVVEAFVDLKEAGVQSFIVAGTHDSPATVADGASPHALLQEAGLATVFEETSRFTQKKLDIGGMEVSIAGISTDKRLHPGMDPLEDLTIPAGGDFNIAMFHYSVEKIAPPIWEEPQVSLASLERNGQIQLFTVGHIHRHVQRRMGDSLILYPGATERFNFGEAEYETGFCYIEIDDAADVEFIKTRCQPMTQARLHASGIPAEQPTQSILEEVAGQSDMEGLMQLILEGEIPFEDYVKIDFARIFDEGRRLNFYFEYQDRLKPLSESIELQPSEGFNPRDKLVSMAREALENAASEDRRSWERALDLAVSYYDRHAEG